MATTTLTPAASASRSGLYEWLTTTDHKKIGILYLINSFVFFFFAGILALVVRTELAQPGLQFVNDQTYNELFSMHAHVHDLPVHHPDPGGLRELRRAAPDRRAGHGLPADQRPVALDAAARRDPAAARVRDRRDGGGRLDELRAALRGPRRSSATGTGQDLWIVAWS